MFRAVRFSPASVQHTPTPPAWTSPLTSVPGCLREITEAWLRDPGQEEGRSGAGRDELWCGDTRPPTGALEPGWPLKVVPKRDKEAKSCVPMWPSHGTRLHPGRVCNLKPRRTLSPGEGQLPNFPPNLLPRSVPTPQLRPGTDMHLGAQGRMWTVLDESPSSTPQGPVLTTPAEPPPPACHHP